MLEILLEIAARKPEVLINFGGLLIAFAALRVLSVELRGLRASVDRLTRTVAGDAEPEQPAAVKVVSNATHIHH